ncbi:hypothetical protein APHAL10511_004355 [Amanita phalloides]|nr:hypothetical protein APHAL10511_004355 [Amanita phalloides]
MSAAPESDNHSSSILHRTPWRLPVAVRGQGIYYDLEGGQRIIDGVGGAAVACIGNGHPKVVQAMKDQIDKVAYTYNMQLSNEPAENLARSLVDSSNGAFELCVFVAGGSEAMEGITKLGRQYYNEIGQPQRTNYIARKLSFHGNTLGTLSLAYHPARRAPYLAIMNTVNFHHVSPAYAKRFQRPNETEEQYVERLRQELEDKFFELGPDTVIGFVAETVVGAATGAVPAPRGYFKAMKSVCDKYGALFILDEASYERHGSYGYLARLGIVRGWSIGGLSRAHYYIPINFALQPDIEAVAKGLGGGYAPIGAILMSEKVVKGIGGKSAFWPHGHTYQAHPVSCAAALAVQEVIRSENLLENIRKQGAYLGHLLQEKLRGPNALAAPFTFDIRGGGGFWGVEFDVDVPEATRLDLNGGHFAILVQGRALKNGLIVMGFSGGANLEGTKGEHIIFAPAFNITKEEVEVIVGTFVQSVEEIIEEHRIRVEI